MEDAEAFIEIINRRKFSEFAQNVNATVIAFMPPETRAQIFKGIYPDAFDSPTQKEASIDKDHLERLKGFIQEKSLYLSAK